MAKHSTIFANPTIYKMLSADHNNISPVQVQLGENWTPKTYMLVGPTGGIQPFRTQYDVAVNGRTYVLTAGKGVGTYQFTLLEGSFNDCNNGGTATGDSFMKDYASLKGYASRKIRLVTTSTPTDVSMTYRTTGRRGRSTTNTYVANQQGETQFVVNLPNFTGSTATTRYSMTFTGVIDNVITSVNVDETTGQPFTQIQVTATGVWTA